MVGTRQVIGGRAYGTIESVHRHHQKRLYTQTKKLDKPYPSQSVL